MKDVAVNGADGELNPPVRRKRKWKPVEWLCTFLVLIPLVGYVVFNGFPVIISFISQFVDMQRNDLDTMQWNNFENFKSVFTDSKFWKAWGITLWLTMAQFVSLAIALLIATLLEQKIKGVKLFQIIFFVPYICSTVAVSIMWAWIFAKEGILNSVLGTSIKWLDNTDNPQTLTWAVFITIMWAAPGYGIVMFKAALKNINPAQYEAASIDGANGWQKFWIVTFPSIKSVTLFLLLAGITTGLGTFDAVTILAPVQWTGIAGPDNMGLTIVYYTYIKGVQDKEMEYAAVMSWFLFIVTFAISFVLIKARNKAEV